MRCIDCEYTGNCFNASIEGVQKGAFILQLKCPKCGSLKVLFDTGEFEEQLRILVVMEKVNNGISSGKTNRNRDFVIRHLREALVAVVAEADGNERLSRRLHARAKLRLITMSDEDLRELAKVVSCPPDRPVEIVYEEIKGEIDELKQTATEWMKDLHRNAPDPEEDTRDRVLIVENDDISKKELVSAFSQAGFLIVDAPDYSKALQSLYEFSIDLVVMDCSLPDWDGFEACSELRNRFNIPVILLGLESGGEVWEKVSEVGAEHYEVKPCKYLALVARGKAILRRYKAKRSPSGNNHRQHLSPGQDGPDSNYLSEQDVSDGFSITMDDRKNITLSKSGNQVAWFSSSVATKEAIKVFIKLIKTCEQ